MQLQNGVTDCKKAALDGSFITHYLLPSLQKFIGAVVDTSLREVCRIESVVIEWFK